MALPTQILLGLALGVVTGLFFGESMAGLRVVGSAFVKLLQMTVLPYVVCSLVVGLGSLEQGLARKLALRTALFLGLLWAVAALAAAIMPLSFPDMKTASFFSTALVETHPPIDFVSLYIPANPFESMATNAVPAVVVFSVALGMALMGVPGRQRLIAPLQTLIEALHRIASFVLRLMPYGVFAIGASAAGTMSIAEFERIQVYLVTYIVFALILAFWVLPGLVAQLTSLSQRRVVTGSRGALVMAFATASEFVVLPLLADRCKEMLRGEEEDHETDALVDVLIPIAYTFPHVAKLLSLSFIPFAAWFVDVDLKIWQHPVLLVSGIASLFGSINVAMPFLLDLMRLPEDLFQLFLATGVLNARFGTLLGAMHILVLSTLVAAGVTGRLKFRPLALLRFAALTAVLVAAALFACRTVLTAWVDTTYRKGELLGQMQLLRPAVPSVVYRDPLSVPATPEPRAGASRLQTILERKTLRVCYLREGKLPFAFFNSQGELVGLDIEMAHSLARGIGATLEFIPVGGSFHGRQLTQALNSGACDIGMSRTALSMAQQAHADYSDPYLELNLAFIVRDHRRDEFEDRNAVEQRDDLRIAVPNDPYYQTRLSRYVPNAELVPVPSVRTFLEAEDETFDAMLFVAEIGSAWSLLQPEFAVVVPQPPLQRIPMAYRLPAGEFNWLNTVNSWVALKTGDGTVQELYNYWVLGLEAEHRGPRWSIVRDVLGWVD